MGADFYGSNDRVLTWSDDGTARLWDARSGEQIAMYRHDSAPNTAGIWLALLSPDGSKVLTTGLIDQQVRMWEADTGKELWSAEHLGGAGGIWAVFSPDGSQLLVSAGQASVLDAATGKKGATLGDPGKIGAGEFRPDGRSLVTGSDDGVVRRWDTRTGNMTLEMVGVGGVVHSVAYSPDGRWVVTTAEDGLTRVWDAASGALVGAYGRGSGPGISGYFANDDQIVTTTERGARVDRCDACASADELLELAAHRGTRRLSAEERAEFLGDAMPPVFPAPAKGFLETLEGAPVFEGLLPAGDYREVDDHGGVTFSVGDGWQVSSDVGRSEGRRGRVRHRASAPAARHPVGWLVVHLAHARTGA